MSHGGSMSDALRLAEWLDSLPRATNAVGHMSAAMELRRLHAENERLRDALLKLLPEMRGLAMVSPLMGEYVRVCESALK